MQISRVRGMATVSDDPLSKKVEMTIHEKVPTMNLILFFFGSQADMT